MMKRNKSGGIVVSPDLHVDHGRMTGPLDTCQNVPRAEVLQRFTGPERDAILAGLRLLQWSLEDGELSRFIPRTERGRQLLDIYNNSGEHDGLSAEGIDALCERLNT